MSTQPKQPIKFVITENIDGKEVRMRYNRYISKYEKLPDEPRRGFFSNGKTEYEKLPDGSGRGWFANGQMKYEYLPDGSERDWFEDGQMAFEILPDGTKRDWIMSGQLVRERESDGTETKYNRNGKVIYHATQGKEDTKAYLKAKERRGVLRKIVAERIEKRDKENPNAKKERVIENKTWMKLKVA